MKLGAGMAVLFLWVYMTVIFIRGTGYSAAFWKPRRPCDASILCQSCLCLMPSTKKQEELIPKASCLSKFLCIIGFPGHWTLIISEPYRETLCQFESKDRLSKLSVLRQGYTISSLLTFGTTRKSVNLVL